jgi:peptidyl-prolyl cis-trans isomerase C
MVRRILAVGLCAAAIACSPQKPSNAKSGPVVASGDGITITAAEFEAELKKLSPFIMARYASPERKKEFLENLIRSEVLAKEAERQGLQNDPDVQSAMKKAMVQKLTKARFQEGGEVPEAEIRKYYDEHKAQYSQPKRVRAAAVIWQAPQGSPERAKKLALAKKALAKLQAEERKKNALAFAQVVAEFSEDAATKAAAGDLQPRSLEELTKAHGADVANAAFKLKAGETSGIVEAPQGLYLLKYNGEQAEFSFGYEQVKDNITKMLQAQRRAKEYDEWLKGLREKVKIQVDDKALEAIVVAPPPGPGAPGGHPGMGAMPGMQMPAPSAVPVPAAAPPAR